MCAQPKRIIAVEDSEDERLLLQHAAHQAGIEAEDLLMLRDGQEAIDYLCRLAGQPGAPPVLPRLMLLDLALPRFNGFELLDWLRRQPLFQRMPVVVLTNSLLEQDRTRARKLGAAEFKTKPQSLQEFARLITELRGRYLAEEPFAGLETTTS